MFYGQGYASADDVVGHEMTHGVISHNSDLFYTVEVADATRGPAGRGAALGQRAA